MVSSWENYIQTTFIVSDYQPNNIGDKTDRDFARRPIPALGDREADILFKVINHDLGPEKGQSIVHGVNELIHALL